MRFFAHAPWGEIFPSAATVSASGIYTCMREARRKGRARMKWSRQLIGAILFDQGVVSRLRRAEAAASPRAHSSIKL